MKMTHEEYIEKNRKRAAEIAKGMLDDSNNYLEGSIELASLRYQVGVHDDDSDFLAFSLVSTETDHLPIGKSRQYWSKKSLERHEPDIKYSTQWAKEVSLSECKSILERFKT